jgi:dihydrofolate reductase
MENRQLILYIAASLDGFIAKPGDDLSFLDRVQKEGEDYGYHDFISNVDTIVMGRKTYDWVLARGSGFPHAGIETYVITHKDRPDEGKIKFYSGDLRALITDLKKKEGKNIFCDGGAEIVNELLKEKLFDELILSVIPVLLGAGIRLFMDDRPEQILELDSVRTFETGLVQLHYFLV